MSDLIGILRKTQKDNSLREYSKFELEELIGLFSNLLEESQFQLENFVEVQEEEDDYDDEGFIEIEIDGKPDMIKRNIKVLNVSCNNFETLPRPIYTLKRLEKLYLYNNRFSSEEKRRIRQSFPAKVQIYF